MGGPSARAAEHLGPLLFAARWQNRLLIAVGRERKMLLPGRQYAELEWLASQLREALRSPIPTPATQHDASDEQSEGRSDGQEPATRQVVPEWVIVIVFVVGLLLFAAQLKWSRPGMVTIGPLVMIALAILCLLAKLAKPKG